jgi:hypothetical protein
MNNIFLVAMGVIGGGIATGLYTALVTKKYANDYNTLLDRHRQLQGRYDELTKHIGDTKASQVPVSKVTSPMMTWVGPDEVNGGVHSSQLYERFGGPFEQ